VVMFAAVLSGQRLSK